jgi:hypothetical protein
MYDKDRKLKVPLKAAGNYGEALNKLRQTENIL